MLNIISLIPNKKDTSGQRKKNYKKGERKFVTFYCNIKIIVLSTAGRNKNVHKILKLFRLKT